VTILKQQMRVLAFKRPRFAAPVVISPGMARRKSLALHANL